MELTEEQLETVKDYFQQEQLSHFSLEDDLVDHCCSGIEDLMKTAGYGFDTAFALMKERLVPNGAQEIEEDLEYLESYKPQRTMRKFVFASGYLSTLCLVLGIVLISLSLFKRESVKMDRLQNEKMTFIQAYNPQMKMDANAVEKSFHDFELRQASLELEVLESVSDYFETGQLLVLMAIGLFSLTYLPYQFYKRYQKSSYDYSNV